MAAEDGTKRWAIAPPPPQASAESKGSGEFTLALNSDLLDPDSPFFKRRSRPPVEHSQVVSRGAGLNSGTEGLEPFDSDRPTDVPSINESGYQGSERDLPTIPAPMWPDDEASGAPSTRRPAPSVATERGFFLESLATEPALERPGPTPSTLPPIDFDSDDAL